MRPKIAAPANLAFDKNPAFDKDPTKDLGSLSIGLFGGSFNPAHQGHLHVAQAGLRQIGLDRIWWLISPQNPLKAAQPSYESRAATVKALPLRPNMEISRAEIKLGGQYSIDLIRGLKARQPYRRFVFLMGADNFLQLPQWKDWQAIIESIPIAIIARPDPAQPASSLKARLGLAAQRYRHARIAQQQAHHLAFIKPPCWSYLTLPLDPTTSTQIRQKQSRITSSQ